MTMIGKTNVMHNKFSEAISVEYRKMVKLYLYLDYICNFSKLKV